MLENIFIIALRKKKNKKNRKTKKKFNRVDEIYA